ADAHRLTSPRQRHRPAFVRGRRLRQGSALERPNPLALPASHSEPRLPIQPIRLRPVDLPALTPTHHSNPPIAVAALLCSKLDVALPQRLARRSTTTVPVQRS